MPGDQILNKISIKYILIICFLLIAFALAIMIQIGPEQRYEVSIYDAYPITFWFCLIFAFIIGQFLIIKNATDGSDDKIWIVGLLAILIIDAILLFMPMIRGYYIYGTGDVLSHIGYMKDILNSGEIGTNTYPIDHILGVILHMIAGLSLPDITMIIPQIFSFFFILSMYILGKQMNMKKSELLLLITFSTILLFGNFQMSFSPNGQSLMLIPFVIYLIFKFYHTENKILLFLCIILNLLLVCYHPLVSLLMILILVLFSIIQYIPQNFLLVSTKKINFLYVIILLLVFFIIWTSHIIMVVQTVTPIIDSISGNDVVTSELQKNINLVTSVNIGPEYLMSLVLYTYGQNIILGLLSLFCIFLLCLSILKKQLKPEFYQLFSMVGFLFLSIFSGIMFMINGSFGFTRIYSIAMIFSIILVSSAFFVFFNNPNWFKLWESSPLFKICVIGLIMSVTLYFSVSNLYLSPIIKRSSQQVTHSDYDGMKTFFQYREDSLKILEFGISQNRFYDAIFGRTVKRQNVVYGDMTPPDHMGYQSYPQESISTDNPCYFVLNDQGRKFYQTLYPEFMDKWRFSPQDFERLKRDKNYNTIYSNANLEIYLQTKS